ncbi:MAG: PepSY-like domain-containing protein [Bacteroides sp.]|nr:PepSY-like domain-containing protein [Bacteroides sp.]
MKKLFALLMVVLLFAPLAKADDIVTKDEMKLPAKARTFIKPHFLQTELSYIKIDKELLRDDTYDVVFTNGTEIEFDSKGEWKEIDGKRSEVPSSVLPDNIRQYIQTNFSGDYVTKVERNSRRYDVELNNDLTLKFDWNGNFLKLDD